MRRSGILVPLAAALLAAGWIVSRRMTPFGRSVVLETGGNVLSNFGALRAAEGFYRGALRCDRSNGVARVGLAWTLHTRGRTDEALAELDRAETLSWGAPRSGVDMARSLREAIRAEADP